MKVKSLFEAIFLNIAIFILSLCFFELCLRLIGYKAIDNPFSFISNSRIYTFDPVLFYRQKPNLNIKDFGRDVLYTDNLGMKISFPLKDKKCINKKVIVILGDSFVWGNTKNDKTYPSQLQNLVGEENACVVNAGISGYGTDQEYVFLKEYILKHIKPDIIVWNININDISDNIDRPVLDIKNEQLIYYPQWKSGPYLNAILSEGIPMIIKDHSLTYNLISTSLIRLRPATNEKNVLWSIKKIGKEVSEVSKLGQEKKFALIIAFSPSQTIVENLPEKNNQENLFALLKMHMPGRKIINQSDYNMEKSKTVSMNKKGETLGETSIFLDESLQSPKGTWHPNETGNLIMANSLMSTLSPLLQNK